MFFKLNLYVHARRYENNFFNLIHNSIATFTEASNIALKLIPRLRTCHLKSPKSILSTDSSSRWKYRGRSGSPGLREKLRNDRKITCGNVQYESFSRMSNIVLRHSKTGVLIFLFNYKFHLMCETIDWNKHSKHTFSW